MKKLILFLFLGALIFCSNDEAVVVKKFLDNIKEKRFDLAIEHVLNLNNV